MASIFNPGRLAAMNDRRLGIMALSPAIRGGAASAQPVNAEVLRRSGQGTLGGIPGIGMGSGAAPGAIERNAPNVGDMFSDIPRAARRFYGRPPTPEPTIMPPGGPRGPLTRPELSRGDRIDPNTQGRTDPLPRIPIGAENMRSRRTDTLPTEPTSMAESFAFRGPQESDEGGAERNLSRWVQRMNERGNVNDFRELPGDQLAQVTSDLGGLMLAYEEAGRTDDPAYREAKTDYAAALLAQAERGDARARDELEQLTGTDPDLDYPRRYGEPGVGVEGRGAPRPPGTGEPRGIGMDAFTPEQIDRMMSAIEDGTAAERDDAAAEISEESGIPLDIVRDSMAMIAPEETGGEEAPKPAESAGTGGGTRPSGAPAIPSEDRATIESTAREVMGAPADEAKEEPPEWAMPLIVAGLEMMGTRGSLFDGLSAAGKAAMGYYTGQQEIERDQERWETEMAQERELAEMSRQTQLDVANTYASRSGGGGGGGTSPILRDIQALTALGYDPETARDMVVDKRFSGGGVSYADAVDAWLNTTTGMTIGIPTEDDEYYADFQRFMNTYTGGGPQQSEVESPGGNTTSNSGSLDDPLGLL